MTPVKCTCSLTPAVRAALLQPGPPRRGEVTHHHQVQLEPASSQATQRSDEPLGALADVAAAHRQDERLRLDGAEIEAEQLVVGAVGRCEIRRDPRPDGHDPVGVAPEAGNGVLAGVLGDGHDEISAGHPLGPGLVALDVGGGGEVVARRVQGDEVVQGDHAGHAGGRPVRDHHQVGTVRRRAVQERCGHMVDNGTAIVEHSAHGAH